MIILKNQLKRMNSLMSINESNKYKVDLAIIGDKFADYILGDFESEDDDELVDFYMTTGLLIKKIKTVGEEEDIKNLIISIGSDDYFSDVKSVNILCDLVREVYPYADVYVLRGNIDERLIDNEEELEELNEIYELYYNEFSKNGFKVVGNHLPISDIGLSNINPTIVAGKLLIDDLTIKSIEDVEVKPELTPKRKNNYIGLNDDETDFDTIYEFLSRFEKSILKTKNTYILTTKYNPDVEQIQISLKFLYPDEFGNLEINGLYDEETFNVIKRYQTISDLPVTGDADFDTNETIYYNLKIKGFDDDDLAKFLGKIEDEIIDYSNYVVDITKGGFDSEQTSNIKLMIDYMNKKGITHPFVQIGILSTIGKESNFKPQDEICYDGTPNSDIRKIFGDRVSDLNEMELTELKNNCEDFFNKVYGNINGNLGGNDGYEFRGRGFNGITGRGVYQKYGNLVGQNLVSNPEILNDDMDVAAAVAVAFFTNGVSTFPEFDDKEEASEYFANKNAGLSKRSMFASNAISYSKRFDVKPK